MYKRRRRRKRSTQRSPTSDFSFSEDATSVSTCETSVFDAVENANNVSPQSSSENFLFPDTDSADEHFSENNSIVTEAEPSSPSNLITPFQNEPVELSTALGTRATTRRRHSYSGSSRDTNLFSTGTYINELSRSSVEGQLVNSVAGDVLTSGAQLNNSSNNVEIVEWELLEDFLLRTKKKASKTSSRKSCENIRILRSPSRKRFLSQSYDNLFDAIGRNKSKSSTAADARKYTATTNQFEADESGVLKKRFEVEKIVDHCTSKNKRYYYVKWKGWDSHDNTWEPEEHLKTCKEVIKDYIMFLRQKISSGNLFSSQTGKEMQDALVVISRPELENIMRLYYKCNGVSYTVCSEEEIVHKMKSILRLMKIRKGMKTVEKVKTDILYRAYDIYRLVQIDALQAWEKELNTKAIEKAKILVENNVDLEGPPYKFTYVNDYIPGKGVIIPDEPPIGCMCGSKCDRRSKECCGAQSGSIFAYSSKRLLVASVGVPIYECNKRCKCGDNCSNRVVQRGRKVDLSIFRTSNGCGWGVKTLQHIKSGAFICEYVGEVITTKEAERRGKIYDAEGRTYLFDLDFNVDACPYTVDAAVYGNISHFINHSCNPNVAVFAVWINCLDPNLPKLALFAKKDIRAGEELTFDYMHNNLSIQNDMNVISTQLLSTPRSRLVLPDVQHSSELRLSKIRCKCGAEQCKRYLF